MTGLVSSLNSANIPHLQTAKLRFMQLDSQQFAISFDYDAAVIQSVKSTFHGRDREWHPESKTWRFPLTKYEEVLHWALQHYSSEQISLLEEVSLCGEPSIALMSGQARTLATDAYFVVATNLPARHQRQKRGT